MTEFSSTIYSELDANNNKASPNGFPEGMKPSGHQPSNRALIAATKKFYNRLNATVISTGETNAYALAYEANPSTLSVGEVFTFWAHASNTGPATLAIGTNTAKPILQRDQTALVAGNIGINQVQTVVWNGNAFLLPNASSTGSFTGGINAGSLTVTGATTLNTLTTTGLLTANGSIRTRGIDGIAAGGAFGDLYLNNLGGTNTLIYGAGVSIMSTNGLAIGSRYAASQIDVSKHIDLYGAQYGLGVTANVLSIVANAGNGVVDARGTLREKGVDVMTKAGGAFTGAISTTAGLTVGTTGAFTGALSTAGALTVGAAGTFTGALSTGGNLTVGAGATSSVIRFDDTDNIPGAIQVNNGLMSVGKGSLDYWPLSINLTTGQVDALTRLTVNGSNVITAANIGSQSVSYASSAGNASSLAGYGSSTSAAANTHVLRDGNGYASMVYGFAQYLNMSHPTSQRGADSVFYSSNDDYIRKNNKAGMQASLDILPTTGGTMTGNMTIQNTSPTISMTDTDNGNFAIHCNSGFIGFLYNGGWMFRADGGGNLFTGFGNASDWLDARNHDVRELRSVSQGSTASNGGQTISYAPAGAFINGVSSGGSSLIYSYKYMQGYSIDRGWFTMANA